MTMHTRTNTRRTAICYNQNVCEEDGDEDTKAENKTPLRVVKTHQGKQYQVRLQRGRRDEDAMRRRQVRGWASSLPPSHSSLIFVVTDDSRGPHQFGAQVRLAL